ncbi:MAG TPA: hypothetical protein VI248_13805 [Kineosporiaceae bacterium]
MTWNIAFRRARITALGTAIVAGVVGAALLAGPRAGAQAAQYPESYFNGGFCYQHPDGQENKYRLQVTEINYDPSDEFARFSVLPQKWDGNSNQYRDDAPAFQSRGVSKLLLVDNTRFGNPNSFCHDLTNYDPHLRFDQYSYGVWTSRHEPGGSPAPARSGGAPNG